jgi:outer membrane protein assembly factor BamB
MTFVRVVARSIGIAAVGMVIVPAVAFGDWTQYLGGATHSSASPGTAITVANAASLHLAWTFHPPAQSVSGGPVSALFSSPTVYQGRVYIGTGTGDFYTLDQATGQVIWSRFLGFRPALTCPARGITATAAVAIDPATGRAAVFVYAADSQLYSLDAATGAIIWSTAVASPSSSTSDYYAWSSPTIANGRVYVGVASQCDQPLIQGGLRSYAISTGRLLARYDAVPTGYVGGSIWTSPAVTNGAAYVATGNPPEATPLQPGDSSAIVRLDPKTLVREDKWTIDASELATNKDFGSSPTPFSARLSPNGNGKRTQMIGACNKDGTFYALRAATLSAGPVWTRTISAPGPCLASAVWNGTRLFVAGPATTIEGVSYAGSVSALSPTSGAVIWELGLPSKVIGTPSINASGVLAVATDRLGAPTPDATYLINAASGQQIATITAGSAQFAQPVFSDGYLLLATQTQGLRAYTP